MKRWEVGLCCGAIALGLCVALYSTVLRVQADAGYRDVMLLVDWQSLSALTAPPEGRTDRRVGQDVGAAHGRPAGGPWPAPTNPGGLKPALPEVPAGETPAPAVGAEAHPTEDMAGAEARPTEDAASDGRAPETPADTVVHPTEELISPAHWELLEQLPGAYLCYGEETLGSLLDQGILAPARQRSSGPAYSVALERYSDDVYNGALRHGYLVQRQRRGGRLLLTLPALPAEELSQLPICWLSEVREAARVHGVKVILRPGGSEFLGPQGIARTFEYVAGQPLMLFHGPTVLGYPAQLGVTADQLKQAKMRFGWVEFDEQDGGAQLAAKVAPYIVRVHSIPPEEMQNYDVAGAALRIVRAVRERSIRCVYLRPFVRGKVVDDTGSTGYRQRLFEVNREYFGAVHQGLADAGYKVAADAAPPAGVPGWLEALRRVTVAWAAGAAVILLLLWWFPGWPRQAWWALRIVNVLAAVAAVKLDLVYTLALIACALAFPLLGFWLALWLYQRFAQNNAPWCPRRLLLALGALLLASVASALGGMLIHGGLWDSGMILKVGQFRGVTPALALPILFLAGYAWQAETLQDAFDRATLRLLPYWQRFMALWTAPIRYGDVAFIMVALGAVGIVLLRSGNDSPLEVLSVESWFRGSLEQVFAVRPRTKELLGHPMLVLFLLSLVWRNRLSLLFGLAALLGQVSILNTFCHLHTPLALTLQRVGLGVALGVVNGALWGGVLLLCHWVWAKLKRRD